MQDHSTVRTCCRALFLGVAIAATPAAPALAGPSHGNGPGRWRWLADTYWIVPPANLPAVVFDAASARVAPISDQTVYHINGYREGYFWGKNVTQIGTAAPSCSSLVGSVTPEGRVLLSFTTTGSDGAVSQQQGFGEMVEQRGQWTMLNQTSSANFAHWAYMVESAPGDASWHSLPGVGLSVTAFLAQCPGDGAQSIGR